MAEQPQRMPHIFLTLCFHHTTGGITLRYGHWANNPCPSTIIRGSYATLWHNGETSIYLYLPYVTMLHLNTTGSQPYMHQTMDYTLVTVARNSSAHAHIHLRMLTVLNSEAEMLNILKLP